MKSFVTSFVPVPGRNPRKVIDLYTPRMRGGGGEGAGIDLSLFAFGVSVSGTTAAVKAGAIRMHGLTTISVSAANVTLGGTLYIYVEHTRGSGTGAIQSGATIPTSNATAVYVPLYKYVDVTLSLIYHVGDINFDAPIG